MTKSGLIAVLLLASLMSCNVSWNEKAAKKVDIPGTYVANDSEGRDTLLIRADGSFEERGGGRMMAGIPMNGKWEMKGMGRVSFDSRKATMSRGLETFVRETPSGAIKVPINDDLGIYYVKEGKKLKGGDTADVPN